MAFQDRPRQLVLDILSTVFDEGGFANELLAERLREKGLESRDRAFVSASVYGVLAYKTALDYELNKVLERPLERLPLRLQWILRYGLWQLRQAYAVPAYAALNSSVELAKANGYKAEAALVNAVLRRLEREPQSFPKKLRGVELGLGTELYGLLRKWFGDAAAEALATLFLTADARTDLRVNRRRLTAEALQAQLRSELGEAAVSEHPQWAEVTEVRLGGLSPVDLPAYRQGLCSVQDAAAQVLGALVQPKSAAPLVLDLCAAPGGKTLDLAERYPQGQFYANDLYPDRLARIREGAERLGLPVPSLMAADARELATAAQAAGWPTQYDVVLADVPCSGLGLLGRKVEIRHRSSYQALQSFPALQAEILEAAAGLTKAGGVLLYSTCTLNPAENEDVVRAFLASPAGQRFSLCPEQLALPGTLAESLRAEPLTAELLAAGMVLLRPDLTGTDGFFIARMEALS